MKTTWMDRKNEMDYNFCSSLTSYFRQPKPSYYCVRKLFTILNSLHIENFILDVPKLFKRDLQMVLCLILSAYPCTKFHYLVLVQSKRYINANISKTVCKYMPHSLLT